MARKKDRPFDRELTDQRQPPPQPSGGLPLALDPVSAKLLRGFAHRLMFVVGIVALAAILTPDPLHHALWNLRKIFAISAVITTVLGLFFQQRLNPSTLSCFDEAAAFIALALLADTALSIIAA